MNLKILIVLIALTLLMILTFLISFMIVINVCIL